MNGDREGECVIEYYPDSAVALPSQGHGEL